MPTVDRDLATTLTQELVRIPSVNPDLVPGAPGEAEVAGYIAGKLRDWGLAVDVAGTAAHGSRPDLGVDAIVHMGKVLAEIDRWQDRLSAGRAHPLLGTGSVHASLIEGGRELSSYPDHCRLKLERRTVPPEDADTVLAELQAILEKLRTEDGDFRATSELLLVRKPFEADPWSDIFETVSEALARVTGEPAVTMTHTGWLDSALLGDAGIPTVICGPIGEGLHALVEWADTASLGTCAQLYADVIEGFCA